MRKLLLLGLISCGQLITARGDVNDGLVAHYLLDGSLSDASGKAGRLLTTEPFQPRTDLVRVASLTRSTGYRT
jgi:hypothetical protein